MQLHRRLRILQRRQIRIELIRSPPASTIGASSTASITAGSCSDIGSIAIGSNWLSNCSTAMSTAAFNSFFLISSIGPAPAAVNGFVSIATSVISVEDTSTITFIFNAKIASAPISIAIAAGGMMSTSFCRF